jgi:hypothetical protein
MTVNTAINQRDILLVLDNLESDWAKEVVEKNDPDVRYHLFTIGFSPEQALLKYKSAPLDLRKKVIVVSTAEISPKAEKEARKFYLEFIRDYPRQEYTTHPSIMKVLSYRRRNLWWYLAASEKNIWNDPFIHRMYALLRLHYACENGYHEAHLYVTDILLRDALRKILEGKGIRIAETSPRRTERRKGPISFVFSYFFQVWLELVRITFTLTALKVSGVKANGDIDPESTGFFSTYPDWWRNPFSREASDLFFGVAQKELEKKETVRHILLLMPWRSLLKKRREVAAFLKERNATVLEGMLRAVDIFSLFDPKLFLRCRRAFLISCSSLVSIKGVDISPMIRKTLFQSLTNPMFFHCLLMDRALRRLPLQNLKALFFRLEFQPLERAILYNTLGKTKTIGFQHSALGKNFLNYVFPDGELGNHWSRREDTYSMPLPDYILTSGEVGIHYMRLAGYPEDRLAVGGQLRFSHLYDYVREMPPKEALRKRYTLPLDKRIILVATSPLIQETICMIDDLFRAAKQVTSDFYMIIKCHPEALNKSGYVGRIQEVLKAESKGIPFDFLTGPVSLHDYIALSDAILMTGGTVALEAMLLGCTPLIYINDAQFSHNPMTEYPDAVILINDLASMKKALDLLSKGGITERLRQFWDRPIRDMFGDTSENPVKKFLSVLTNQFHI